MAGLVEAAGDLGPGTLGLHPPPQVAADPDGLPAERLDEQGGAFGVEAFADGQVPGRLLRFDHRPNHRRHHGREGRSANAAGSAASGPPRRSFCHRGAPLGANRQKGQSRSTGKGLTAANGDRSEFRADSARNPKGGGGAGSSEAITS